MAELYGDESRIRRDINEAIRVVTWILGNTASNHRHRSGILGMLGGLYLNRFALLGMPEDIDRAIDTLSQAILRTPDGHENKPIMLGNLGNSHQSRFDRLGELADIDRAIVYHSKAVSLTPGGHPNTPGMLNNLGNSHQCRFERLREPTDIDRAITCQSRAVSQAPDGHADRPRWLSNLGNSYGLRFGYLGELTDINQAIACQSEAVFLIPNGHVDKPGVLNNLGTAHQSRFTYFGEIADINRAIAWLSEAESLTLDGHVDKPGRLNNLGNSHRSRFERLGELADIDRAITCHSKAVSLSPDGHADQPGRLSNLGNSHQSRFQRLGELADIDRAITCHSKAVSLTLGGHAKRPIMLNNLGNSHQIRFERLGELADVDRAVASQSEAVCLTPDGHADKPRWLNNLGNSHQSRFERLGELADIDRAIACHSKAVSLAPGGHANTPTMLDNLGNSHLCRFERFGEPTDIDQAIACQSQAVSLTPDGNAHKPTILNNLGNSHQHRFKHRGELTDINQAIACQSEAVSLTPNGHSDKLARLSNLGIARQIRFERLGEPTDRMESILVFQLAAKLPAGKSTVRLRAAIHWARLASSIDPSTGLPAYDRAMQLVPQAIWIGATISTRYDDIHSVGTVAMEAAAAAIAANEYGMALEWLEAGRSIVWNQTLQLRTQFDDLASVAPSLAINLKQVAQQLESTSRRDRGLVTLADSHTLEAVAQEHHRLAERYETYLTRVRELPGFQDFLGLKRAADLITAAQSGPVVVVNVHSARCDALILLPNCRDIAHIPLPGLAQHNIMELRQNMQHFLASERAGQRRPTFEGMPEIQFESILAVIWNTIVEPVLSYLGYLVDPSVQPLPRITWCTTGTLSFIPIHAAGCYYSGGPKIFDFAVSSYSTTLRALLSAQSGSCNMGRVLAVGQEATPGCQPLKGTKTELAHIQQHAKTFPHKLLEGDEATVEAVLAAMEKYSSVHLACHGSQIVSDPTKSCFHLHDGSLSLAAIAKRSFKNKGLAFLSACETATGDEKMPDEAVHLAAGMLAAGYPTVIATMWSINDGDAPLVADLVYGELMKDGRLGNGQAARALHRAVKTLRESIGENQFGRWVPYIHMGV